MKAGEATINITLNKNQLDMVLEKFKAQDKRIRKIEKLLSDFAETANPAILRKPHKGKTK